MERGPSFDTEEVVNSEKRKKVEERVGAAAHSPPGVARRPAPS